MTYFANPAGQPPPPPGSPPPAAAPPQPEFGYHHQQRHQWSRPQPALPKAALAHPSAEATSPETSPVSVASAPSPHDSDGNVTFGMPHKLGARRGLPAGRTKKRRRRASSFRAARSDDDGSSSSSASSPEEGGESPSHPRRSQSFHPLLSEKCDSREFNEHEPRLLEMDGPLWPYCGRRIVPVSPIMHLSADVVCRVSKVIASERRCIALDVVGVPAPRLPEGDSGGHRIVVDHLVIATMHGVTVIGPPTAKGDHKMLRDMLAAQLIGHLKLYRNTVHVVIPRADTVDRTCRFLGLKHGALTGMINVVQWVRKWAAAKKAHGAAVLAKSIVAGLEASGGGELSVETLCNFFLPYKPHFTGPPTENVERLPKHVRSHAMAHVAFFTRKVFLMFFTRATDPDASTVAARSDDSREEECVSVATSQPEPGDPTTTSGKSPMAALSGADVQDMAGVADGIRQLRQGNSGLGSWPLSLVSHQTALMHAGAPRRGALSSSPAPKTPARTLRGGLASHRPPPSRGKALPVRGGMMAAANVTSLRGRRSIAKAGTVVRATWKPLSSRGGLASPSAASSRVSRSPLARYPGSAPSTTIPRPLTVTRRRADPPIDLTGDSEPSAQRSAARARPSSPRPCTVLRSPRPYLSPPAGQPVVRLTPAAAAEPGVVTPSVKVSPSEGPPPASTILSVKERMEVLKASLEAAAEAGKAAPTVTEHASGQLCQRTRDPSASEQRDPDTKDSPSPRPDSATDRGAGERLPTLSPEERASLATSVLSFISHELKAAALSRMYLCR